MEFASQPYVRYSKDDVLPAAPQISLHLEDVSPVPGQLSLTLPYWITFTLARKYMDHLNACMIRWTPRQALLNSDIVILRLTEQGLERVHIEPQASHIFHDTLKDTESGQSVHELRTGGEIKFTVPLPMHYQYHLKAGERYQLHWPGGELDTWDWGGLRDHAGKQLRSRQDGASQLPKLIVPASKPIIFTAVEESELWLERPPTLSEEDFQMVNEAELRWRNARNPPPLSPALGPADHVANTPVLSMEIDCPREWPKDTPFEVELKVTYTRDPSGDERPFTFHVTAFISEFSQHSHREGFYVYQDNYGAWKSYIDMDAVPGFSIWDDPPIPVKVGDAGRYDSSFATLYPGESWTHTLRTHSTSLLPPQACAGDKFLYRNKGAVVDWWDWGTKEDHKQTEVKLHCAIGCDLEEPKDNGGRPKLVVPGSNEVVVTCVDRT